MSGMHFAIACGDTCVSHNITTLLRVVLEIHCTSQIGGKRNIAIPLNCVFLLVQSMCRFATLSNLVLTGLYIKCIQFYDWNILDMPQSKKCAVLMMNVKNVKNVQNGALWIAYQDGAT